MNRETVTWQRDSGSLLREIDEEFGRPADRYFCQKFTLSLTKFAITRNSAQSLRH